MVGERAQFMLSRVQELAIDRTDQRVANALLRMISEPGDGPKEVTTTRQDLAELCATTIHTVSRFIAQWQREGIVDGGRGRITVRNVQALREIAQQPSPPR
jgi:CRP-like cAMP-binding protein